MLHLSLQKATPEEMEGEKNKKRKERENHGIEEMKA